MNRRWLYVAWVVVGLAILAREALSPSEHRWLAVVVGVVAIAAGVARTLGRRPSGLQQR